MISNDWDPSFAMLSFFQSDNAELEIEVSLQSLALYSFHRRFRFNILYYFLIMVNQNLIKFLYKYDAKNCKF
jgi:hypothetical protein